MIKVISHSSCKKPVDSGSVIICHLHRFFSEQFWSIHCPCAFQMYAAMMSTHWGTQIRGHGNHQGWCPAATHGELRCDGSCDCETRCVSQAPVRSVSFWIVDIVEELGNHGKPSPFQWDSPTNSNKMNGLMLLLCVQNEDWDGIHVPTCRETVPWLQGGHSTSATSATSSQVSSSKRTSTSRCPGAMNPFCRVSSLHSHLMSCKKMHLSEPIGLSNISNCREGSKIAIVPRDLLLVVASRGPQDWTSKIWP